MPLDTSIYSNIRPIQLDNPLNNYAQIAGIQNAQNQNRLADIQYRQALKVEEDDAATREAISGAGGDYSAARNALMSRGLYKPAMAIDKQNLDTRKTQAEITEKDLAAAGKRYETWSSAMAPLINKPDLSHDDILAVGTQLERAGVIQPGWKADVPMNALQLPDYVKGVAMRAEQGRKAVEMMLPKVQMVDSGGTITPWNTNTMAGSVGPLAGAQPVTKVATPGEVMTDTRTREEGAKNRGVTMRGQDLVSDRTREANDIAAGKLGESAVKQTVGVKNLREGIQEYRDALKNFGGLDALRPDARARMGTYYNNMMLQAKEAYNLGVLNGPDFDILQSVITDPRSYTGAITSKSALDDQAKALDELMGRVGKTVTGTTSRKATTEPSPMPKKAGKVDYSKMSDADILKKLKGEE